MDNGIILNKFRENLKKYSDDFSSGKLWEKLKESASKLGVKVVYTALQLYYLTLDPKVSLADKAIITAALGYLILPLDLVPDFMPAGFLDDGIILAWALKQMNAAISDETRAQALAKLREWFPNADLSVIEESNAPRIEVSEVADIEVSKASEIKETRIAPAHEAVTHGIKDKYLNKNGMTIYLSFDELSEYIKSHHDTTLRFARNGEKELKIEYEKKVLIKTVSIPVNLTIDKVLPASVTIAYNGNTAIDLLIGGVMKFLTKAMPALAGAISTKDGHRIIIDLKRLPQTQAMVETMELRDIDILEDAIRITASLK
ncbi:MAG: DUF1232 domain-containing protein [Bacteroides sp.]|nr:DUF1232 domain-containing protein [Bacteroides sp.]